MRSLKTRNLIAALGACALLLGASGCNDLGDEPKISDAYVQVTGISYTGTSLADIEDVVVLIKFDIKFRDNTSSSNALIDFDTFTYSGTLSGSAASGVGVPNTVHFSAPSTDNIMAIDLIPAGARVAGVGDILTVHFDGRDLANGRAINMDVNLAWSVTP